MKDAFLWKVHPPIHAAVHVNQEVLTKQEEGLTNEGRHHAFAVTAHDKGGIAESLHTYITIARLPSRCSTGPDHWILTLVQEVYGVWNLAAN